MEESNPAYWKPHVTALVEACEEWESDDIFKEIDLCAVCSVASQAAMDSA